MRNISKNLLLTIIAILIIAVSFGAGYAASSSGLVRIPWLTPAEKLPPEFDIVGEVWGILSQNYVDKQDLDPGKLSQEAVEGMLKALGDPYTSYLDAEDYQLALESFQGEFGGIGAWVKIEESQLVVVGTIGGSPAEEAGIKQGDRILEIDGESTAGMSLSQAVLKVRGEAATTVTLLVLPQGETTPVEVAIVREKIVVPSVSFEMIDNIAYIEIAQFSEHTDGQLRQRLEGLPQGVEGVILDLRNNPGGLLSAVMGVASQFLGEGKVVLYEVDSDGNQQTWTTQGDELVTGLPLVVLVNQASASGSEVLAAALRFHLEAPLIGTQTYGKGSINVLYPLEDGSAVYVTVARWLTTDGQEIEGIGLSPNPGYEVEGAEAQLQAAIDYTEGLEE